MLVWFTRPCTWSFLALLFVQTADARWKLHDFLVLSPLSPATACHANFAQPDAAAHCEQHSAHVCVLTEPTKRESPSQLPKLTSMHCAVGDGGVGGPGVGGGDGDGDGGGGDGGVALGESHDLSRVCKPCDGYGAAPPFVCNATAAASLSSYAASSLGAFCGNACMRTAVLATRFKSFEGCVPRDASQSIARLTAMARL